jgi:hypothetical protein
VTIFIAMSSDSTEVVTRRVLSSQHVVEGIRALVDGDGSVFWFE